MKCFTLIIILSTAVALSGCDATDSNQKTTAPSDQKATAQSSTTFELKINRWGPDSAKIGIIPNKQPDGSMGIWIEVSSTENLGEAQVLFDGHPAKVTSVQPKLITASISSEELAAAGDKDVSLKQTSTGKVFPVGTFKVSPK